MLGNLTGWHFLIILVVILLLFGAPKLPGLARSLGQSMKIFKSEIKSDAPPASDAASSTGATPAGSTSAEKDESKSPVTTNGATDSTSTKS